METGISVYPGLGGTIQEKTARIERAAALGMTRLFTSFHIPETDPAAFRKELQAVLDTARQCQLDIVADVSPASAACLGMDRFDPEAIAKLGITTVRFDDGFDAAKLAMYSHIVRVQVNASTLTQKDLEDLQKNGAQLDHIDSLHNFYPRPHTGLALDYFKSQTDRLHAYGLSVGAFVASQAGQRAPLYEGLPTLEFHRHQDVSLAARHLAALGVQSVFIGDDKPADKELRDLARRPGRNGRRRHQGQTPQPGTAHPGPVVYTFTARPDPSRDVIRANGSRLIWTAASSNRTATSFAVSTAATSPWTTPISCVIWRSPDHQM